MYRERTRLLAPHRPVTTHDPCSDALKCSFAFLNLFLAIVTLAAVALTATIAVSASQDLRQPWFRYVERHVLRLPFQAFFVWLLVGIVVFVVVIVLGFCSICGGCGCDVCFERLGRCCDAPAECCGRERRFLLGVYVVLVFVVVVFFVAALLLFYPYPRNLASEARLAFREAKRRFASEPEMRETVDGMQRDLRCCLWNETDAKRLEVESCFNRTVDEVYYSADCFDRLLTTLSSTLGSQDNILFGVVVVAVVVAYAGMCVAISLCLRKEDDISRILSGVSDVFRWK